jgi:capsid protein
MRRTEVLQGLRRMKLELRRRIEQFQRGTLVFQPCRPVWQSWLCDAVLSGALGYLRSARYRSVSGSLRSRQVGTGICIPQ